MIDVLHVISGLNTGGAETMLASLVRELRARGLSQHVVSIVGRGTHADEIEQAGVGVTSLGVGSGAGVPQGVLRVASLIRRQQPRIIQGWMYHGNVMAALAHRASFVRAKRRLFWNLRASNMDDRRYGRIIRWSSYLSGWPDLVIANSKAGAEFHVARGYRPRRIEVIFNGIDTEKFRPDPAARAQVRRELGLSDDATVAIHVARVDPMKDHATFLGALAQLPHVTGLLVGAGTEDLALPGNVRALGLRHDVARLYPAADLVVSSSAFGEAFSNVLAEGMSAGLVPVGTQVGDASEIVGETGTVIEPGHSSKLARAIAEIGGMDKSQRQARGLQARERIVANFTIGRATDAFVRLYAPA